MTREIRFNYGLQIDKDNLHYRPAAIQFSADMDTASGPTPGVITATTHGTTVSFAGITTPGVCTITNLDATNYVEVGIWDGASFFPLMEVLPGESWPLRLSRFLGSEYGTSTPGTATQTGNVLRVRAHLASCKVVVSAFNK